MKLLKLVIALGLLVGLTLMLTQCGPVPLSQSCVPNVIDSGLRLNVTATSSGAGKTYTFKLCDNVSDSNLVYSVYGANSATQLRSTNPYVVNNVRKAHISDATQAGTTFQVEFFGTDTAFAIYSDKYDGFSYQLDVTQALVQPRDLP